MIIGFFDLETTSLDTKEARIIEWAVVRYCTELRCIIGIDTELVKLPAEMDKVPDEAFAAHGISAVALDIHGEEREPSLNKLMNFLSVCDAVVTHNGTAYDRPVFETEVRRFTQVPVPNELWVDTMFDLPYPPHIKTRNLGHLAAEHGFLNPLPHRALADCITLWKIFTHYAWEPVIELAKTPVVEIRADVPYAKRDLAKAAGYRWDGERKIWSKNIRQGLLAGEKAAVEFPVLVL